MNAIRSITMRIRGYDEETEELSEDLTNITGTVVDLTKTAAHPEGISLFTDSTQQHYKSMVTYLGEISDIWDELEEKTQTELLQQLFGKSRANVGAAIITNFEAVRDSIDVMAESAGSADREMTIIQDSIEYKVNELKETVVGMLQDLVSSDLIKGVVDVGTSILNLIDGAADRVGVLQAAVGTFMGVMSLRGKGLFKASSIENLFSANPISGNFIDAADAIDEYNKALNAGHISNTKFNAVVSKTDLAMGSFLTDIRGHQAYLSSYKTYLLGSVTGFKNINAAIEEYNGISAGAVEEQESLINVVQKTNTGLATYLQNLNGAKANFGGYILSLAKATAKTIALNVATAALNMGISMLISFLVSKAIKVIDDYIHRSERIIEKAEEAADTIKSLSDEFKSAKETTEDLAERFDELSQGVDRLSGKNISLSDEDYKEFLNTSNKLAELFPSLTRNYDENGNAIVLLDDNVNGIVGSLNELIKTERELTNQKIAEQLPDNFAGVVEKNRIANEELEALIRERDSIENQINETNDNILSAFDFSANIVKVSGENQEEILEAYNQYANILKEEGINFSQIDYTDWNGNITGIDITINEDSWQAFKDAEDNLYSKVAELRENLNVELNGLNKDISAKQNEISQNWKGLTQSLDAWLYTDASYQMLSDDMRAYVQSIVNNLDYSSLDFGTLEELESFIQDNILNIFTNSDSKDLKTALTIAIDTQTAFNNNEVDFDTYQKRLNNLFTLLEESEVDEDTVKSLKLLFNIEFDSEGNEQSTDLDRRVSRIADKVQDEFDDKIGSLSLEDLKIADGLKIEKDTLLSWDELLEKIQEYKDNLKGIDYRKNLDSSIKDAVDSYIELGKETQEAAEAQERYNKALSDYRQYENPIDTLAETSQKLGTQVKPAMDAVVSAYQSIFTEDGFSLDDADITDTIESIRSQIQSLNDSEDFSIEIDSDGIDKLAKAMSETGDEAKNQAQDIQDAFNQIATDITESAVDIQEAFDEVMLGSFTEETTNNLNLVRKALEDMGVATMPVVDAESKLVEQLDIESMSAQQLAQSIALLQFQKQITNQTPLNTVNDVQALYNLGLMAGFGQEELIKLKQLMDMISQYDRAMANHQYDYADRLKAGIDAFKVGIYEDLSKLLGEQTTVTINPKIKNSSGAQSSAKDAGEDLAEKFKEGLQNGLSDIESMISYIADKISDKIDDLNDELQAKTDALDDEIDALNDAKDAAVEALEAERDAALAAIDAEIAGLEAEIDAIEKQQKEIQKVIDAKQDEIDAIDDANKKRQQAIDLQKAEYELARAQQQKTILLNIYGRTCSNTRVA